MVTVESSRFPDNIFFVSGLPQRDKESKYAQVITTMNRIVQQRQMFPWLQSDHLFRFSSLKKVHDECLDVLHGFTNSVIQDKRKEFLEQGDATAAPKSSSSSKAIAFLDLVRQLTWVFSGH